MSAAERKPLEGLLVVAVEQAVAAPYCTCRLADAGARVIKIERPEGDFARGYDRAAAGSSSYFVWLNRGKESLVLDLRDPADKAALRKLVGQADILMQNLKPGSLARLGLPLEDLRAENPRLITCSIAGYSEDGPFADRKAYDLLIQAESGLASITGGPAEPARVGVSVVDIASGAQAYAAILEAVIKRGITGKGEDIRLSMFDVMADWMTVPFLHAQAGNPPKRIGLAHPSICPYGVFGTGDGREILFSIQNEREWKLLCQLVLDSQALAEDPAYDSNNKRVADRAKVDGLVSEAFAGKSQAELVAALDKAGIAYALVNGVEDLADHSELSSVTVNTAGGMVSYPAPPALHNGARRIAIGNDELAEVPELGEHSDALRKEFGL
ncbi:CaiB/BaiF CoA transferase family protein [Rhodovibrionaceae bacterium A322]